MGVAPALLKRDLIKLFSSGALTSLEKKQVPWKLSTVYSFLGTASRWDFFSLLVSSMEQSEKLHPWLTLQII